MSNHWQNKGLAIFACWICSALVLVAGPLTLPFSNPNTPLWQGWLYDGPYGPNGNYHGAIDYGTPAGTSILAAADGYAWYWEDNIGSSYSWGRYVAIYHPSSGLYTLSAHLSSVDSSIPMLYQGTYRPGTGKFVARGQRIGAAGNTGTDVPHLHFEVSTAGLGTGRVDPYNVYAESWYYPGPCTGTIYWTQCPPVPSGQQATCTSPGSYVDISNPGDFNGDNKQEFVRFYKAVGRWDVALSSGSDFRPLSRWFCGLGKNSVSQLVGDVNGDGRDDAVIVDQNSNGNVYVSTSTGSKFSNYYQAGSNLMRNMTNRFLEDVNGDGKDDLIGWKSGAWYVSLSNGFSFGSQINAGYASQIPTKRMVGDVNGDGRADAVIYYSWGTWWVALGKTSGKFGAWTVWDSGHGRGASDWFLSDVNGDGRDDAVCFWNNVAPGWQGKLIIHESTGSSFRGTNIPRAIGHGVDSSKQMFGDYTGDGREDFAFWYPSTGWWVSKSDGWGYLVPTRW